MVPGGARWCQVVLGGAKFLSAEVKDDSRILFLLFTLEKGWQYQNQNSDYSIRDNWFCIITPLSRKCLHRTKSTCRQENMPKVRYLRAGNSKIIKCA